MRSMTLCAEVGDEEGHDHRRQQDEEGGDRAEHHRRQQHQGRGHPERLAVALLAEQFGEDRDEGRLQGGIGEQGADQVRHLEGDRERRHRPLHPVVAGSDDFAAEAGDARGAGRDREEGGRAGDPPRLSPRGGLGDRFLARIERLGAAERDVLGQRDVGVDRPLVEFVGVWGLGRRHLVSGSGAPVELLSRLA